MDNNWLTEELVAAVFGKGVKRSDVTLDLAGPAADNFLSDIYRVSCGQQSYVVKLKPAGSIKSVVDDLSAFEKELYMYDFLEEIEKITGVTIGPKRIKYKDMIIMEDQKAKGFSVEDRRKQLGLDHCKAAMKCLAQFHAASYIILKDESKKKQYQLLREDIYFGSAKEKMHSTVTPLLKQFLNKIKCWPEVQSKIHKLEAYIGSCFDKTASEVLSGSNSGFLTHGDFHTSNIMFNNVLDVRLIDFQMSKETTPAVDLILFMLGSIKPAVRKNHLELLLQLYVDSFNTFISPFNDSFKLTVQDIKKDMSRLKNFTFYTAAIRTAMILSPTSEDIKENSFEPSSSLGLFDNSIYRETITSIIQDLEGKKLFD